MRTVWKFCLAEIGEPQELLLPHEAEIVHGAIQEGRITLWAEVDTDEPNESYEFLVTGTGHPVPENAEYLGTCQNGPFVWHIWELR